MEKKDVLSFLIEHSKQYCREKTFLKKFPEYYNKLSQWTFPIDFTFQQKLYHYFHNDINLDLGVCSICGKRCHLISFTKGYSKHCSYNCSANDINLKEQKRNTCKQKYGVDYYVQCDEFKMKTKESIFDKYGVLFYSQTEDCQHKSKMTCLAKYGVENYSQTDECKQIVKEKMLNTKRKNKSFTTSKIEEQISVWLSNNSINYIRQYKSDLYPFACDFYLTDYDLYIEIQGTWTHGGHPFDENSKDDRDKLELWKSKNTNYYKNAIDVWTIRDVKKRNTAKEHNLLFLEIFSTNFDYCTNQIIEYI